MDGPNTLFIDGQYDEARPTTLGRFSASVLGAEFATIPGAGHGFFYYDRPAYRVEQALDGWQKVWAFCEKHLSR